MQVGYRCSEPCTGLLSWELLHLRSTADCGCGDGGATRNSDSGNSPSGSLDSVSWVEELSRRLSTCLLHKSPLSVYVRGPNRSTTVPLLHRGPVHMFLAHMTWSTENSRARLWRSWYFFCRTCWAPTRTPISGLSRCRRVRSSLPINRVRGATPVVAWGIERYRSKKAARACSSSTPRWRPARITCFTVWTRRSAAPLSRVIGWWANVLNTILW